MLKFLSAFQKSSEPQAQMQAEMPRATFNASAYDGHVQAFHQNRREVEHTVAVAAAAQGRELAKDHRNHACGYM